MNTNTASKYIFKQITEGDQVKFQPISVHAQWYSLIKNKSLLSLDDIQALENNGYKIFIKNSTSLPLDPYQSSEELSFVEDI